MILSLEEVFALVVAWFRRQIWGLTKFVWWWKFRATARMRFCVASFMYQCILQFFVVLLEAGVIRRGRIPNIHAWIDKRERYMCVWHERLIAEGPEEVPASD